MDEFPSMSDVGTSLSYRRLIFGVFLLIHSTASATQIRDRVPYIGTIVNVKSGPSTGSRTIPRSRINSPLFGRSYYRNILDPKFGADRK